MPTGSSTRARSTRGHLSSICLRTPAAQAEGDICMRQHEPRSSRRFRAKFNRSARSRDDLDVSDYRVKVMLAAIQAGAAENVRARTRNSPVAVLCQR
ncbi:unnamed protein product [Ectocarpus fasciculatus]